MKLVFIILSTAQGQKQLPCVKCTTDYEPVCGREVKSGELRTFQNKCHMMSEDCGKYEPRKFTYCYVLSSSLFLM
jgi:hypothetical protein